MKRQLQKGFTMVELMVVLAILGILMAIAVPSLSAYTRHADFVRNENTAKTVYLAAQSALTHYGASGQLSDYLRTVEDTGYEVSFGGDPTDKRTGRIRAICLDKGEYASQSLIGEGAAVTRLLEEYTYDKTMLDASICLEIDMEAGQVYSVFYSSSAGSFTYAPQGGRPGETSILDREYEVRRERDVGYYSTEDLSNVVDLRLTRLRLTSLSMMNHETLTLNWGSNSRHQDLDVVYDIELCRGADNSVIFATQLDLSQLPPGQIQTTGSVTLGIKLGAGAAQPTVFPVTYDGKQFSLTLDAMMSARLMEGLGTDATDGVNRSSNYSITRFGVGAEDIYARIKVSPNDNSMDDREYAASGVTKSNTVNALFGDQSKNTAQGYEAQLSTCRHLSNLRHYADPARFTLAVRSLDWSTEETILYDLREEGGLPQAVHGSDPRAFFPAIPRLEAGQTLDGGGKTLRNLRLGNLSLPQGEARYLGLIGWNSGVIKNLTLENISLTAGLEDTPEAAGLPGLRGIGALCGGSSGSVGGIDVTKDSAVTATVALEEDWEDSPVGIGGVVGLVEGSGVPMTDVSMNGTVTGVLADRTGDSPEEEDPREWYAHGGIGGVAGYCNLEAGGRLDGLTNNATVRGNMFVGGVAGNVLAPEPAQGEDTGLLPAQVENCRNNGRTLCTAAALAGLPESREGLFVGGIVGYGKNAVISQCLSAPGTAEDFVFQGTQEHLELLRGNYVGGVVGFSENGYLLSSGTKAGGYVLGNDYVGGIAGGLANGDSGRIRSGNKATVNASNVIGHSYVGGIVGVNSAGSRLTYCTNNGVVAGTGRYIGGIVGANQGEKNNLAQVLYCTSYVYDHNDSLYNMVVNQWGLEGDYVGGIAGYNEYGLIRYDAQDEMGSPALLKENLVATIVSGGSYVGGVVGCNGAAGQLNVEYFNIIGGKIHGTGDCVGGYIGLNLAEDVLSQKITVQPYRVDGRYCVGGVIGANVVATDRDLVAEGFRAANPLALVRGQGLCGGIMGYNRLLAAGSTVGNQLPLTITSQGLVAENSARPSTGSLTLGDGANADSVTRITSSLNIRACAYAGGILGYNSPDTRLLVRDCVTSGSISKLAGAKDQPLTDGVSLKAYFTAGGYGDHPFQSADQKAAMVGGIVGVNTKNSILLHCQSQGDIAASGALGGVTGLNEGGVVRCTITANVGNTETDYVGGIVGISAGDGGSISDLPGAGTVARGAVLDCTTQKGGSINGRSYVGGIVGVNMKDASVAFTGGAGEPLGNVVAKGDLVGGVVGENHGAITLAVPLGQGAELLSVSGKNYVGGIVGRNRLGSIAGIDGSTGTSTRVSVLGSQYVGGIAGENQGGAFGGTAQSPMVNRGVVRAGSGAAGGILGSNNGGTLHHAENDGPVAADRGAAGGIAALNLAGSTLQSCVDRADVIASNGIAGGIAGENRGTLRDCAVETPLETSGPVQPQAKPYIDQAEWSGDKGSPDSANPIANAFDSNRDSCAVYDNGFLYRLGKYPVTLTVTLSEPVALTGFSYSLPNIGINNNRKQAFDWEVYDQDGNVKESGNENNPSSTTQKTLNKNNRVKELTLTFTSNQLYEVDLYELTLFDAQGSALSYGAPTIPQPPTHGAITLSATGTRELGAITGVNSGLVDSCTVTLGDGTVTLAGSADRVGTITGANSGTVEHCQVTALPTIATTAPLLTVGGIAGQNTGRVLDSQVTGSFGGFSNYQYQGGVAGENLGALERCAYTGTIAEAQDGGGPGRCYGGIAGINGGAEAQGSILDCRVSDMLLTATGAYTAAGSQTAAQKEAASSHMGGIAGKNDTGSLIRGCVFDAGDGKKSGIAADAGTIGGIAGYNKGTIRLSGCPDTGELMADGSLTQVSELLAKAGEKGLSKATGATENDYTMKLSIAKNGHVGGVTGFNAPSGTVEYCASGRWMVYNRSETLSVTCGGIIGQNEAEGDTRFLLNQAYVKREIGSGQTDRFAGGIISNQENRTSSSWTIYGCVNYGKIFNQNSHYVGGIIGQWSYNGGTLEGCYNYGDLQTTYKQGNHGASAGIVALMLYPTSGQVFNIFSCQNYGSVYGPPGTTGGRNTDGANDCAGILGNISPYSNKEEVYVNLVDCVNGPEVEIYAGSMAAGMVSYLSDSISGACEKVVLHIDRCRNYAKTLTGANSQLCSGILGDRYAGTKSYITNCLSVGQFANPITYSRSGVDPSCTGNYYIDKQSMTQRMNARGESTGSTTGSFVPPDRDDGKAIANRLFLGSYSSFSNPSAAGGRFGYGALLAQGVSYSSINGTAHTLRKDEIAQSSNSQVKGKILLRFPSLSPDFSDITDETVREYYDKFLDNSPLAMPVPGEITTSGYDYTAAWGTVPGALYYELEVYLFDTREEAANANLEEALENRVVSGLKSFSGSGTFAMSPQWIGKFYRVRVRACSMAGEAKHSGWAAYPAAQFKRSMLTPLVTCELIRNPDTASGGYLYRCILENAADYDRLVGQGNWRVRLWFGDPANYRDVTSANLSSLLTYQGQGSSPLRAQAYAVGSLEEEYLQSALYSVQSYTPAAGLPQGKLGTVTYRLTGSTMDTLACEVTLPYQVTTEAISMPPTYRVELLRTKNGVTETVSAASVLTSGGASVTATLADLPRDVLDPGVTLTLRYWYTGTGLGPIYTYHQLAEGETLVPNIVESQQLGGRRSYSVVLDERYAAAFANHVGRQTVARPGLLPAPVLDPAQGLAPTFDAQNRMRYTFAWDQGSGSAGAEYSVALSGITDDGLEVAIDTAGAYTDSTARSFAIDAEDWTYSQVLLRVTRLGTLKEGGSPTLVGQSSQAVYQVSQRLPRVIQPSAEQVSKNDLLYTMTWTDLPQGQKPFSQGYRLWAAEGNNPPVLLNPNPDGAPQPPLVTGTTQEVDLEAFGGKAIRLYVTAVSADYQRYQDSAPGMELSLTVPQRRQPPAVEFLPRESFLWDPDTAVTTLAFRTSALALDAALDEKLSGSYILAALLYNTQEEALADTLHTNPAEVYGKDSTTTMTYLDTPTGVEGKPFCYTHTFQEISTRYAGRYVVFQLRAAPETQTSSLWVYSQPYRFPRVKLDLPESTLDSFAETIRGQRFKDPTWDGVAIPLETEASLLAVDWPEVENADGYSLLITPQKVGEEEPIPTRYRIQRRPPDPADPQDQGGITVSILEPGEDGEDIPVEIPLTKVTDAQGEPTGEEYYQLAGPSILRGSAKANNLQFYYQFSLFTRLYRQVDRDGRAAYRLVLPDTESFLFPEEGRSHIFTSGVTIAATTADPQYYADSDETVLNIRSQE